MELRTNALILRPWKLDDPPAIAEACNDPEIARWLPMIPSPYGEEDALSFIGQAILDAARGQLAGSIGARVLRFSTGHFGYWVRREARGRGVATGPENSLSVGCRHARLQTGRAPHRSRKSRIERVAEKAGFQREGVLRSSLEYRDGRRRDSILFSALPDELV